MDFDLEINIHIIENGIFTLALILQVATSTMDNPLLKYNAKEYFWKASLCHFIVDELNAKVSATALLFSVINCSISDK